MDRLGETPLGLACKLGLVQVAGALLCGGANIDFATPPRHCVPGCTPLMFATAGHHTAVVKLLLERGRGASKSKHS